MAYNETLQAYLKAMNSNPGKVNRVSSNDLGSLSDEDRNTLRNSSAINKGQRALEEESHQDDKTFIQRSTDVVRSVGLNFAKGIFNFFDGIGDLAMGAVGSVASWFGNDSLEKDMKNAINYDWTSQAASVLYKSIAPIEWFRNGENDINPFAENNFNRITTGNYNSNVENVVNSIETGLGEMVPAMAVNALIPSDKLGKYGRAAVQGGIGFATGMGKGYGTVASKDGDLGKGAGYAALKGLISGGVRAFSTAHGGTFSDDIRNNLGESVASKVFGETANVTLSNFVGNAVSILSDVGFNVGTGFLEGALDPGLQMIFDSSAWDKAYGTEEARKETFANLGKSAITSAVATFLTDTTKAITGSERRDFVNQRAQRLIDADPDMKADQEKLAMNAEAIKSSAEKADELNTRLEKETDPTAQEAIKNQIKVERDFIEKAAKQSAMISDRTMDFLAKNMVKNSDVLFEGKTTATHDLMNTQIQNAWDDKEFHRVSGMDVAKDGDSLTYKADTASSAVEALKAIMNSKTDSVRLNASLLGGSPDKDFTFGGDLDPATLDDIETALSDTTATIELEQSGDDSYARFSNGMELHFKGEKFESAKKTIPTPSKQAINAPEYMKKDTAVNGYISQTTAKKAVTATKLFLEGMGGDTNAVAKELGTKWDLAKTEDEKKAVVTDMVSRMLDNSIKGEGITTEQASELLNERGTTRKLLEDKIYEVLKSEEQPSTKDKTEEKLQVAKGRLEIEKIRHAQDIMDARGAIKQLKSDTKALNAFHKLCLRAKTAVKDSKAQPTGGNPYKNMPLEGFNAQVLKRMTFSKDSGRITSDNAYAALFGEKAYENLKRAREDATFATKKESLESQMKGFTDHNDEAYVKLNESYQKLISDMEVTMNRRTKMGDGGINFVYDADHIGETYSEETKEQIDFLKSHFDSDGNYYAEVDPGTNKPIYRKTLTIDDIKVLTGVASSLLDQNTAEYKARIQQEKSDARQVQVEAQAIASVRNKTNLSSFATGSMYNLRDMFGKNSKFYKMFVEDVQADHYASARNKYRFTNVLDEAQDKFHVKDSLMEKSVKVSLTETATSAQREMKLTHGDLMEVYAQSLSKANRQKMIDDGFEVNGYRFSFDDKAESAIADALSPDEKAFVQEVFEKGYNGVTQKALSEYSLNKYKYDIFEGGNYINREMGDLRFDPSKANEQLESSLGGNISIRRTNNRNPIKIGNFKQHYYKYCGMAADYISMDNVKRNNALINLKNPSTQENLMTTLGKIQGRSDFFRNWIKLSNNIATTSDGKGGILSDVYSNAMATPITANLSTFMKMYLDPLRMANLEGIGWGKVIKGIGKGIISHISVGNQSITVDGKSYKNRIDYFKQNSGAYLKANAENYALKDNVIANNYSRVTSFLGKPLEFANNDMMAHFAYSICEEKVKADAESSLTNEELAQRATEYFDTISNMALSNSDNLDTSDLRSGRMGSITRALFGIFGGDNQKKTEFWHEAIMGTAKASQRLRGYQATYDAIKAEMEKNQAEFEQLESKLGGDNDDKILDELDKKAKINTDYKNTLEGLASDIQAEKDYTKPSHVVGRLSKVASVAIVSSIIEVAGIGSLNSLLKGKKEDINGKNILTDFAYDTTIGWVPILGTIADGIRYGSGVESLQTEGLNQTISAFTSLIALKDGTTPEKTRKSVYDSVIAMGNLMGLPLKNLMDYTVGMVKNCNAQTAADIEVALQGYNSSKLKKDSQNYLANGNLTKATETTQANLAWFKTGKTSWNVAREITKISAVPRDVPSDLTASQKSKFRSIYSMSTSSVSRLISSSAYQHMDDKARQSAILKTYNAYYDVAKYMISTGEDKKMTSKSAQALYLYLYQREKLTKEQKTLLRSLGINI